LSIPESDRNFYSYALLQGPFQSSEQIDELACYVRKLKEHRSSTIAVLRAIENREQSIVTCTQIIASAHRSSSMKFTSLHDEIRKQMEKEGGEQRDNRDREQREKEQELHHQIRNCIAAVQNASIRVVCMVQAWRRDMWRPHPFV
jgi:pyruvate-formate lyase-activating enzyme